MSGQSAFATITTTTIDVSVKTPGVEAVLPDVAALSGAVAEGFPVEDEGEDEGFDGVSMSLSELPPTGFVEDEENEGQKTFGTGPEADAKMVIWYAFVRGASFEEITLPSGQKFMVDLRPFSDMYGPDGMALKVAELIYNQLCYSEAQTAIRNYHATDPAYKALFDEVNEITASYSEARALLGPSFPRGDFCEDEVPVGAPAEVVEAHAALMMAQYAAVYAVDPVTGEALPGYEEGYQWDTFSYRRRKNPGDAGTPEFDRAQSNYKQAEARFNAAMEAWKSVYDATTAPIAAKYLEATAQLSALETYADACYYRKLYESSLAELTQLLVKNGYEEMAKSAIMFHYETKVHTNTTVCDGGDDVEVDEYEEYCMRPYLLSA